MLGHILGQAWLRGAQGQHAQGEPHEEPLLRAQQQGDTLGEAITVGQIEDEWKFPSRRGVGGELRLVSVSIHHRNNQK